MYYCNDIPYQSYDGGISFFAIGDYFAPFTHADIRSIFIQKASNSYHGINDRIYFANDGGVSKKPVGREVATSFDTTTININGKGLTCGEFWSIAVTEAGDLAVGGMQHDGIVAYEKSCDPTWWPDFPPSDASTCVFDNYNRTEAYALINVGGGRGKSIPQFGRTNGFWEGYSANAGEVGGAPPIIIDSFNTQYEGEIHLWRKLNSESAFRKISDVSGLPIDSNNIISMCFDPYIRFDTLPIGYLVYTAHPNRLYYRNPDATGYLTFISNNTPNTGYFPVTSITLDPKKPERVWISEATLWGNNDFGKVYYSPNGFMNSPYDVSNGLSFHIGVGNIIYQESSNDVLFCATEVGIYRCDFSTFDSTVGYPYNVHWECFSKGDTVSNSPDFPNAMVTDLKINP